MKTIHYKSSPALLARRNSHGTSLIRVLGQSHQREVPSSSINFSPGPRPRVCCPLLDRLDPLYRMRLEAGRTHGSVLPSLATLIALGSYPVTE